MGGEVLQNSRLFPATVVTYARMGVGRYLPRFDAHRHPKPATVPPPTADYTYPLRLPRYV